MNLVMYKNIFQKSKTLDGSARRARWGVGLSAASAAVSAHRSLVLAIRPCSDEDRNPHDSESDHAHPWLVGGHDASTERSHSRAEKPPVSHEKLSHESAPPNLQL